jgi:hypothetical protein
MKRLILVFLLVATKALALTPAEVAALKIPGECPGQPPNQQCARYASLLNFVLLEKGMESHALAYHWSHDPADKTHAVVLFKAGKDWFCIDNQLDTPVRVQGKTDLAKVKCFDRKAWKIQTTPFYKAGPEFVAELATIR